MKDLLRRPGARFPHVLFGIVVGLLALLAAWWFWFLAHAVRTEDELWQRSVELETRLIDQELAARPRPPAAIEDLSVLPGHPRFRAIYRQDAAGVLRWNAALTSEASEEHASAMRRRRAMIYGEGSLLLLLVLGCVGMLYRLVLAEQRYRSDTDLFLGRVTHEMKTPLVGLRALLQTLKEGRVPADRLSEIAELGLRQAEREEHLIENLLTAHRLATRAAPLEISDVDVAVLLREFADHRRRTMGHEADGLSLRCPESLAARGNAGALQTILENLADNAFKYGATRLVLEARSEGTGVVVVVGDDGQGFEPDQAEGLFRPFRRGEDAAHSGRHGTGLGLPIALALAREMGGNLVAGSQGPGRGSEFTLHLEGPREAKA